MSYQWLEKSTNYFLGTFMASCGLLLDEVTSKQMFEWGSGALARAQKVKPIINSPNSIMIKFLLNLDHVFNSIDTGWTLSIERNRTQMQVAQFGMNTAIMNENTYTTIFNQAADLIYGSICFLCFLVGTIGNAVSFFYFKSKKRDISSVSYMMITANDIVVSATVLPVGISFCSKRQPDLLFGNTSSCVAWNYVWNTAVLLSIFLVLSLSVTRTISLLRPFKKLKVR